MKREQNVGLAERWLRGTGGGIAAVVGILFLILGPPSVLWGVADIALALLGVDFLVTGITGYCPLYHRLGWSTVQSRGRGRPE